MKIARRFRGVVGMAATWGIAFATLATGTLVGGLLLGLVPREIFGPFQIVAVAVRGLLVGGLAGSVFAVMLARKEQRSTVDSLSARRAALWGFVGGASVPALCTMGFIAMGFLPIWVIVPTAGLYGAIGAGLGAGAVRLAQRAPALPPGETESVAVTPEI